MINLKTLNYDQNIDLENCDKDNYNYFTCFFNYQFHPGNSNEPDGAILPGCSTP